MDYDIAIVGGGPAGITAAIYAARANKKTILFEGNKLGGTLRTLDKIENFPGSDSDNGEEISASMIKRMMRFDIQVVNKFVSRIVKNSDGFSVFTDTENFKAKYVIYCGGIIRNKPASLSEFVGSGVSYCAVCDGFFFKDKTVAVIGDGIAADEDIKYLKNICKKVYHIFERESSPYADECFQGKVTEFIGKGALTAIKVGDKVISLDGAFISMGGSASELIKGLDVKNGFIVNYNGVTSVPGFFVAGDASEGSIKQVVSACFEGARAVYLCK